MTDTPKPLPRAPLAYENTEFLESPDGRIFRILAEYQEPLGRFRHERIADTVVFFGSARFRARDVSHAQLELLENSYSAIPAPLQEQPASPDEQAAGKSTDLKLSLAQTAVEMSRFYEDARTLAHMVSTWAKDLSGPLHRFVITSGGGPGIMEAANRGAYEAGARSIGLNIKLPFEQFPNRFVTPELNFEFSYFFMRKFWFAYLAKALVVFPGGFGTIDEMFEILTLVQTGKFAKPLTVVIYGSEYWKSVLNLEALIARGAIAQRDLKLFQFADTPEEAFALLQAGLSAHLETPTHLDDDPGSTTNGPAAPLQVLFGPDLNKTRP